MCVQTGPRSVPWQLRQARGARSTRSLLKWRIRLFGESQLEGTASLTLAVSQGPEELRNQGSCRAPKKMRTARAWMMESSLTA